jgi:hypothetical protein
METALLIANLLNNAAPNIAEIILLIKKSDGSIAVVPLLDQADSKFTENMQQATAWLEDHKKQC